MPTKGILAPLIVLPVVVMLACDDHGPTAPSPSPVPVPPVSVAEVWNISVRMTSAVGGECVGDTMQSERGSPNTYSLSVTPQGSMVQVTLRSTSGDYACTFQAKPESNGFTTFGVNGWFSCDTGSVVRGFACADGRLRDLMRLGQNISGHSAGNEITGQWNTSWIVMAPGGDLGGRDDIAGLETTAQYVGSR